MLASWFVARLTPWAEGATMHIGVAAGAGRGDYVRHARRRTR